MNIAAAMAALKVDADAAGLDANSKHALLVIAARCADRHSFTVTRALPALAHDMGVSERTALRAVLRLERKGYLQVTHKVGTTSAYTLGTPVRLSLVTPDNLSGVPLTNSTVTPVQLSPYRRKTREKQEGDARPLAAIAAGAAVDNPPRGAPEANGSTWHPSMRTHPPECQCGGSGWLDLDDGSVTKCEH